MHSRRDCDNPIHCPEITEAATACLQSSPYEAVRRVLCECDHGILVLRGQLSNFHQKQVAQETVAKVKGVIQVRNEIEVVECRLVDKANR